VTRASHAAKMVQARRRDSDTKRARVLVTLEYMRNEDIPITFAAVARQAGVSTWLVYAPGMREHIDHARTRQHRQPPTEPAGDAHIRGLQADLALARAEIRRLRADRDQQQQHLRRALGARLDDMAKADLVARIDELTRVNNALGTTTDTHRRDNETLRARITELEDDLAAARTSLRRMIRAENRPADS
jgi:hypothetical protein